MRQVSQGGLTCLTDSQKRRGGKESIMQIAAFIALALCALLLLSMWPGRGRRREMEPFMRTPIAHRGFHRNGGPAPENSMAAYRLAVEHGYGIELDVRRTADGELICLHDRSLMRAAGIGKNADEMSWSELKELKLFGSDEGIPLFRDVLKAVDGRVPIIMEIKAESLREAKRTSRAAAHLLDSYGGLLCMESFHPGALLSFKRERPDILRGQLAERFSNCKLYEKPVGFLLSCCALNCLTRPDFIAYNVRQRGLLRFRILHELFHAVCAGWTVRSEEELRLSASSFEIVIFEGFAIPRP